MADFHYKSYGFAAALICLISGLLIAFLGVWSRLSKPPLIPQQSGNSSDGNLYWKNSDAGSKCRQLQCAVPQSERAPDTCWSESESHLYYRADGPEASSYLRERLAAYEIMHKRCTEMVSNSTYLDTARGEKSEIAGGSEEGNGCRYVVARLQHGVGNQILSAVSAFLYGMLTNRTLLVHKSGVLQHLCNPFPGAGWLADATKLKPVQRSAAHISVILKAGVNATVQSAHLTLSERQSWEDEIFFCSHGQEALSEIPWLLINSDNYYIPSLFLIPHFIPELARLFPTQHVFLHLGRYLLRPSNTAWERITRLHATHYSAAHSKVGIQVRTFTAEDDSYANDNVIKCAIDIAQVLPPTVRDNDFVKPRADDATLPGNASMSQQPRATPTPRTISVFVTSLNVQHVEFVRSWYSDDPTADGSLVQIWSGAHRGVELTRSKDVDMVRRASLEALCEIFLLSFSDTLLTSDWSTFGYVAAGLSGIAPFQVNNKWGSQNAGGPKCRQARSSEICHLAPPCRPPCVRESSLIAPCLDWQWGVMLLTTTHEATPSTPAETQPAINLVSNGCSPLLS